MPYGDKHHFDRACTCAARDACTCVQTLGCIWHLFLGCIWHLVLGCIWHLCANTRMYIYTLTLHLPRVTRALWSNLCLLLALTQGMRKEHYQGSVPQEAVTSISMLMAGEGRMARTWGNRQQGFGSQRNAATLQLRTEARPPVPPA
jgi:hypothetical protein